MGHDTWPFTLLDKLVVLGNSWQMMLSLFTILQYVHFSFVLITHWASIFMLSEQYMTFHYLAYRRLDDCSKTRDRKAVYEEIAHDVQGIQRLE